MCYNTPMNATIAIPYSEGQVFPHFGKATQFKIYVVVNDCVSQSTVAATEGVGHEALGLWLVQRGVDAVICGGIGPGAQGALAAAGIALLAGVEGSADEAVRKLLVGELESSSSATCDHHGHTGGGGHAGGCGHHCAGCHR